MSYVRLHFHFRNRPFGLIFRLLCPLKLSSSLRKLRSVEVPSSSRFSEPEYFRAGVATGVSSVFPD